MTIDKATIVEFQSRLHENAIYTGHGKNPLDALKDAVEKAILLTPDDLIIVDMRLQMEDNTAQLFIRYKERYVIAEY